MPYTLSNSFRAEKNKKTNRPVILVALEIDGNITLYFARDNEDVNYFKPRTNVPQVYTKFPFSIGAQSSNTEGQIETTSIKVADIFQELSGLIQYYGGLLGNKFTTILAFKDLLDDPEACIVNEYYIDAPGGDKRGIELKLSTKFNTLGVRLPLEIYTRNHCQHRYMPIPLYNGVATSIAGNILYDTNILPAVVPATVLNRVLYMTTNGSAYRIIYRKAHGIVVDRDISSPNNNYKIGTECGYFGVLTTCDHTKNGANGCKVHHGNVLRFGAFPGIPQRRPYTL